MKGCRDEVVGSVNIDGRSSWSELLDKRVGPRGYCSVYGLFIYY